MNITQELLNSLMREPGERTVRAVNPLPKCPLCTEHYCGDGTQPCVECQAPSETVTNSGDGGNG